METLITQDFKFPKLSRTLAEFIIYCGDFYPDASIANVSNLHAYSPEFVVLSFRSPSEVAVLLKLKFGKWLAPERLSAPDEGKILKMKILKNRNTYTDFSNYLIKINSYNNYE